MGLKQQVYGLGKKVADMGGDFALKFMPSHDLDVMRGERADAQRKEIRENREHRNFEKSKGY